MAKTMSGGASAPAKRGRGRPPGSASKARPGASTDTAPGLGHNAPDEGVFLAWVQRLRRHEEKIAEAKALVKVQTNIRKDLRKEAGSHGLVMGDLDEALEDLAKEKVDLEAREERRRLYRTWLGLPTGGGQIEAPLAHAADPGGVKDRWTKRANQAGRLGEDPPLEGSPPELHQDIMAAWHAGQEVVMRASKLLGAGFTGDDRPVATPEEVAAAKAEPEPAPAPAKGKAKGKGKAAEAAAPPPEPSPAFASVLVLDGHAFPGVDEIDDCNRKVLAESKLPAWDAAETVLVIMGGKKRILKEPADGAREAYEDTGEEDVPLSDVEEAGPEDLAAVEAAAPRWPFVALDDDPENWFASDKTAVREWLRANPDAILPKHAGVLAFAQTVAEADRIAGEGDSALAAIAEAEPELVEQVVEDHGADGDEFE